MIFAQIILILVFIFLILKTYFKRQRKELSGFETSGWLLLWLAGLMLAIKPDTASYFAKILGIGRGIDLAIYIALISLFYLQFRLMVKVEKINREITKITREKTLEENK
ncbi:MAG TPA: DUF2304 family protein [Candidatus Magasanikbacteria bacterium]|nr:DUF2304 family protein [Candidatus Magasanikbacteria bacterium]